MRPLSHHTKNQISSRLRVSSWPMTQMPCCSRQCPVFKITSTPKRPVVSKNHAGWSSHKMQILNAKISIRGSSRRRILPTETSWLNLTWLATELIKTKAAPQIRRTGRWKKMTQWSKPNSQIAKQKPHLKSTIKISVIRLSWTTSRWTCTIIWKAGTTSLKLLMTATWMVVPTLRSCSKWGLKSLTMFRPSHKIRWIS